MTYRARTITQTPAATYHADGSITPSEVHAYLYKVDNSGATWLSGEACGFQHLRPDPIAAGTDVGLTVADGNALWLSHGEHR